MPSELDPAAEGQVLMERNGFSLLVVPRGNEARGVREIRLSGTRIVSAAAIALSLSALFVAMAVTYGSSLVDQMGYQRLQRENQVLRSQLEKMNQSVLAFSTQMEVLAERDETLRLMAEMEPLADEIRQAGVGGSYRDFDSELLFIGGATGRLAMDTQTRLNQLNREAMIELESLLDIESRLSASTEFLRGYPSIWPIDETKYRVRISSAYGWRTHPVTSLRDFHEGIDVVAPRSTPVRATADGRVDGTRDGLTQNSRYPLGNFVKLDHGNGYITYYGHLESLHPRAKNGARVKRGDIIGYVGKSGRTTGYHLHYEVLLNGDDVNPWYQYYMDRWDDMIGR